MKLVLTLLSWQPSLAGSEVRRRLPCSGGFWAREESVTTPYYALWDGRTGDMGGKVTSNLVIAPTNGTAAYHPSPDYYYSNHHPAASPSMGRDGMTPSVAAGVAGTAGKSSASAANSNKLGAVAYCIEATEHLTLVTAFFARQPPLSPLHGEISTTDGKSAGAGAEDRAAMNAWLTRFKELDLRLVHWKMNLPPQWADWHVSLKIDPNLTLCHLSHLTSMVLLHQHIAYPPPQWSSHIRPILPSVCSAAICELAVVDIVAISQKYLRYVGGLVCGQFAFCLFVAARFTLVHNRIGKSASTGSSTSNAPTVSLAPPFLVDDTPTSFVALLDSLDNISVRWRGYCIPENEGNDDNMTNKDSGGAHTSFQPKRRSQPLDLAAQYASRLRSLHQKAMGIGAFTGVPVATTEELTALLSTSSMEGLIDLKSSSHTRNELPGAAAPPAARYASSPLALSSTAARYASSPLALSSTAASHLRSPSVIHGGGVEMAGILQNPVPASVATGRTPAITPKTAMDSRNSVVSPSNGPDGSIVGYGSIRGGPVTANVSNVRIMPETPATAGTIFNMDMMAQQHSQQPNPLHHLGQHQAHPQLQPHDSHPQDLRQQHQHGQQPQHMQQQQERDRQQQQQQHQHQQHQQRQQQFGIDEEDEFAAMSHLLMGNQFLDMDRVLISNDTSFLLR